MSMRNYVVFMILVLSVCGDILEAGHCRRCCKVRRCIVPCVPTTVGVGLATDSLQSHADRAFSHADRVNKAKKLLADAKKFPKGCSGFVSEVLGIDWKSANAIMGANPTVSIGRPPYNTSGLTPGDIVGWYNGSGSGHVAVFIGEPDCRFIDVKEDNATSPLPPRKVMQYENTRELFKSKNY